MWFLSPFLVFSLLGTIGILSLLPMTVAVARKIIAEDPAIGMNETTLGMTLLINPMILLLIGAALGTALADRVGLRSVLLDLLRNRGALLPDWRDLALAAALGLAAAAVILLLQLGIKTMAGAEMPGASSLASEEPVFAARASALLYGGITEEIITRFGLMTLLLWIIMLVFRISDAGSSSLAAWSAIILAAAIFGLGHLSLAAAEMPLTATTVLAIILLNAIAGTVYGWLFWQKSLELAMLAHMTTHIGFWTLGPAISAIAARLGVNGA